MLKSMSRCHNVRPITQVTPVGVPVFVFSWFTLSCSRLIWKRVLPSKSFLAFTWEAGAPNIVWSGSTCEIRYWSATIQLIQGVNDDPYYNRACLCYRQYSFPLQYPLLRMTILPPQGYIKLRLPVIIRIKPIALRGGMMRAINAKPLPPSSR